jgi:hypothetical protein
MQKTNDFIENLSPHLFWDTDKQQIDPVLHRAFLVERIMSHGLLSDWLLLKAHYSHEVLRATVLQLRYMDKYSLHFCMAYFNEPIQHFRCYNYAQSNPAHWNY